MGKKNYTLIGNSVFLILNILLVSLIVYLDYVTGDINFALFYLLPIVFTTWRIGLASGIITGFLCTCIWVMSLNMHKLKDFILWWDSGVRFGFYFIIAIMVWTLKSRLERERELARKDFLTEAANNMAFFERLSLERNRCLRSKLPISLIFLDCDYFKVINDVFGHKKGDSVLKIIVRTIQKNVRITDMVARIGGDEFIILLPETAKEVATKVVQRMQRELLRIMDENKWPVTFSIGVATFIFPQQSPDEMLKKVDELMFDAKNDGRNLIRQEEIRQ